MQCKWCRDGNDVDGCISGTCIAHRKGRVDGYAEAIADVVAWLRERARSRRLVAHGFESYRRHYAEALEAAATSIKRGDVPDRTRRGGGRGDRREIERGAAKGAAKRGER